MLDFLRDLFQYLVENRCDIAIRFLIALSSGILSKLAADKLIALKRKWQQRLH